LATSLVVREDSLTLFGFADAEERELFTLLQTVSGVGPRLALATLAVLDPDALRRALADGDATTLTRVPGIGRKGAERMVLELRDKVVAPAPAAPVVPAATGPRDQVVEALLGLGFPAKPAEQAVDAVLAENGVSDAAAVLRAANEISGARLPAARLRELAAWIGSDVPSQVEPRHALVTGVGEQVEAIALPRMTLVLIPRDEGLSTPAVFAELDRLRDGLDPPAARLDPETLRRLAGGGIRELAAGMQNDLARAALSLRPELENGLAELRDAGALAAGVTGSGPTTFGVFEERRRARQAAARLVGSIVAEVRSC
jgi:Holliday junction DNA helicase RuvA